VYWDHHEASRYKIFSSVEFRTSGDDISENYFKLINAHLEKLFAAPKRKEVNDKSVSFEWIISDMRIYLYFFEKDVKKLIFEISRV